MSITDSTPSSSHGSHLATGHTHHHSGEVLAAGAPTAHGHHHHHDHKHTAHNADAPASCCGSCGNQLNCSKAQAWHQE